MTATAPEDSTPRRKLVWIEFLVVFCVLYLPSVIGFFFRAPNRAPRPVILGRTVRPTLLSELLVYQFVDYMRVILPILLIVWLSDRSLRKLGIVRPQWKLCIVVTGCLLLFDALMFFQVNPLLCSMLPTSAFTPGRSIFYPSSPFWQLLPATALSTFWEELLFRGYFLSRLREQLGNYWAPIFFTAAMFAFWHWGQGPVGMINGAIVGLVFGAAYAITGRIWPTVIAHLAYDGWVSWSVYVFALHHAR